MSSRSARTARAAAFGVISPRASPATASVASVPARVNRVGARILPNEQPVASSGSVASRGIRDRSRETCLEESRPQARTCSCECGCVLARSLHGGDPRSDVPPGLGRQRRDDRSERRRSASDELPAAYRLAERERGLGGAEVAAAVDRPRPACGLFGCRRQRRQQSRGDHGGEEGEAPHRYCWISTPSCAACCETCPATASPRRCASAPS